MLNINRLITDIQGIQDPSVFKKDPRVVNHVFTTVLPRLSTLSEKTFSALDSYMKNYDDKAEFIDHAFDQLQKASEYSKMVNALHMEMELGKADFKSQTTDPVHPFDPVHLNVHVFSPYI